MKKRHTTDYPKAYRYRRIVQANRYIDEHFNESIDLKAISEEANSYQISFFATF